MEHRHSARRRCGASATIYSPRVGVAAARVADISATGLFLETAVPLPRHTVVHVRFTLGAGRERYDFYLTAAVVRAGARGAGAVFLDTADRSLGILQRLLRERAPPAGCIPADPALPTQDERAA